MVLKVLSVSALAALALAGTAFGETGPSEDDFNLAFPSSEMTEPTNTDGFNLRMSAEPTDSTTGDFNLSSDVMTSNGLSNVPEFDTSGLEDAPVEEDPAPDLDAVIRLDP